MAETQSKSEKVKVQSKIHDHLFIAIFGKDDNSKDKNLTLQKNANRCMIISSSQAGLMKKKDNDN